MTMVERVARAIMESRGGCDVTDWQEAEWNPHVKQALKEARAAITEMREPPRRALQDAAWLDNEAGYGSIGDRVALKCWETMIDAALSEGE